MHQRPALADWLKELCGRAVDAAVSDLATNCATDEELVDLVVAQLKAPHIELGERYYDAEPWRRRMSSDMPDVGLLRRGIRPGQSYTHDYAVYRVDMISGAELVTCGSNGGHLIDPTFIFVEDGQLVIRAADDRHRDELFSDVADHVERANRIVEQWNTTGLPHAIRRAVDRMRRAERDEAERSAQLESAGFRPSGRRRVPGAEQTSLAGASPEEWKSPAAAQANHGSGKPASQTDAVSEPAVTSVLISWSHQDPGFTPRQANKRADKVVGLANALRGFAIDADVDLFHQHEGVDWTRWGPGRMREVDFVLVACSEGWRLAWDGRASAGAGATAEADVLKSWFVEDRERFNRRVRLVVLPGAEPVIPDGLDRLVRHHVTSFAVDGMDSLLRGLTGRPEFVPAPLGTAPELPPRNVMGGSPTPHTSSLESTSDYGELVVSRPEGLPAAIQQVIDEFVTTEQRAFERSEGNAADLVGTGSAVANHSSIVLKLEMHTETLLSYVAACDYVVPGAATSYQRSVGLTFSRSDGRQLTLEDVLIDVPANLPTLQRAFLTAARRELGDDVTATGVPPEATVAVRPDVLGICSGRYDVGPGHIGAPVVWIAHQAIARVYRPAFARLLSSATGIAPQA